MIKILVLVLLFFHLIQNETLKMFEIETIERERESILNKNILFWYYLEDKRKFNSVIDIVNLSNEGLRFQIYSDITNEDSVYSDISESMIRIVDCVDRDGYKYYEEFNNDIDIGTILIICMSRDGMMN